VQADSHLDEHTSPEVYLRTIANASADRPDFHVDLGDTFMTDKHERREDALAQYVAQRRYFGRMSRAAPVFLALGNHDGESGRHLEGGAAGLAVWSNLARKLYFPNPEPDGFYSGNEDRHPDAGLLQDFFAWTWGDAQFIVLDPFWYTPRARKGDENWARTLGARQYEWLRKTLESARPRYRFVFLHHLVGGADKQGRGGSEAAGLYEWGGRNPDGSDGFAARRPGWPEPIHAMLVRHGVSIVFHGHDHLFAKQDLDGIVYQEVPQPGMDRSDNTRSAADYGYRTGEIQGSSGHVRVVVGPDKAVVDYIRSYAPSEEDGKRKNGRSSFTYSVAPR
jgi:predicted phosphodiesterase